MFVTEKLADVITFQTEELADLLKEPRLKDLILSHYAEAANDDVNIPPNPDWARLLKHEKRGFFKVWTGRDGHELIGYQTFYIDYDPTTSTLGRGMALITSTRVPRGADWR